MSQQIELLDHLIHLTPQPRWRGVLITMRLQLNLPMQDVLEKVPGEFVRDKIAAIGVARNTYYEWMRESFRPNRHQAAKLAELTGYPADAIHGQKEDDNDDIGRAIAKEIAAMAVSGKRTSNVHGRARSRVRRPQRARRVVRPQT